MPEPMTCEWRTNLYGQSEPCPSCGAEKWHACAAGAAQPITRYYTFGFDHAHAVGGFTYDKDIVVKITAPDPRAVMVETFGRRWSMEYTDEQLDLSYYPRGVKVLADHA